MLEKYYKWIYKTYKSLLVPSTTNFWGGDLIDI